MSIRAERKLQSQQAILETVLKLNDAGQNFSSMSLRQLARDVGVVPSALYRYFENKVLLASALVDHVAYVIKSDLNLMIYCLLQPAQTSKLEHFFNQITQHGTYWHFFIAERWGGFALLESKIEYEIKDLNDHVAQCLSRKLHQSQQADAHTLAGIVLPLFFTWIMRWLRCQKQALPEIEQKKCLVQIQAQLMLLITVPKG
ncbi:TetR/AcrR family transcriptional regulator [Acinetobacter sp. MD2(2019)]|uniref:TetR/AcrR family transcriptional regulator n=1 Tax=Acinetobacter sp. MD2(2019) TaxID=2605273 RepID=UPI002D1F5DF3|nr:TetR/AcrR family transcriptional regulator [Acinetobacter sp. MD2(2019)]MEB3754522.1 TetR family transcriptional regulator [Acinetobacter sp. MD2(2019)]